MNSDALDVNPDEPDVPAVSSVVTFQPPSTDWRAAALSSALLAPDSASANTATSHLLHNLGAHNPHATILVLHCDRRRLVEFLIQRCDAQRMSGGPYHFATAETHTLGEYCGWYRVLWLGNPVEVILLPDHEARARVVCMAEWEEVLEHFHEAALDYTQRPAGRALTFSDDWVSDPALDAELAQTSWDDIVLPDELLRSIRETVEGFPSQRPIFERLGFTWRRGILLVGPPGTGKTMLCKAAAAALPELPFLYVRDLRERVHANAIEVIFQRARKLAPCILAFEDLDGLVFQYNRTAFLNEVDGFARNEGILLLASSNHPEKIDEALLKRPSRFDRVFHLGLPAVLERGEYARRLLRRFSLVEEAQLLPAIDLAAIACEVAQRTDGFTPAYLKEAFTAAALRHAQHGGTTIDEPFLIMLFAQIEELRAYLKQAQNPEAMGRMPFGQGSVGFRQ